MNTWVHAWLEALVEAPSWVVLIALNTHQHRTVPSALSLEDVERAVVCLPFQRIAFRLKHARGALSVGVPVGLTLCRSLSSASASRLSPALPALKAADFPLQGVRACYLQSISHCSRASSNSW